ncbi:MAG: transketolase [Myxococcales bacterium]|nr:transketolase [Myxococcales bacterium]
MSLSARTVTPEYHALLVDTIKTLAIDAVQLANSGHPGMPMGAADMAAVLWTRFLRHDPGQPSWPNRDRFVLSAGHGSMLLYALLHLTGYDLPLAELRRFRQWGSKTPGHPEFGHTAGVEVTTGPLGTGFAAGVGMAIAERLLAARYNQPGHRVVDHFTYAIVSDGDLMEGVAAEAASLAGHLQLGKLIYLYDDNQISIDGATDITFTEDVLARFAAYGWHVTRVDGHDAEAIATAIAAARAEETKPSLIACRTVIAKGSPNKAGTSASHGAPLGGAEVAATKAAMGWPAEPTFLIPEAIVDGQASARANLQAGREAWEEAFAAYRRAHPALAAELQAIFDNDTPRAAFDAIPSFPSGGAVATRKAGAKILEAMVKSHPVLVGGSADLAGSNGVNLAKETAQSAENPGGRVIHFGVREHGMAGIANGLALHGIRPYVATFLVFSDFMRGAIRLAALMRLPVIYVLSHDSFWVGEDGPTHQPIEHAMALRMIPDLWVCRPGDARETAAAWRLALARQVGDGPTAILVTRQDLPILEETREDIACGAYVLWEPEGVEAAELDGILIATGSELALARAAAHSLHAKGRSVRVVSMPCWEAFEAQPAEYRDEVLPPAITRRLSVEAGTTLGWGRYASACHGIDHFGASAPGEELARRFGFSAEAIVEHYLKLA